MRRAQVREAQKAYRSRQQTQLSSLKARVEQLEDAFDHLSQTMHRFDTQVTQNGSKWSQPELWQTVQSLRDDIVSQFRHAGVSFEETSKEKTTEPSQSVNEQPPAQVASGTLIDRTRDRSTESNFWSLFLGSSAGMMPPTNSQSLTEEPSERVPVPLTLSVAETHTIPYATTPFTQRLFRASAESGYRFLSNLSYKDEDMWEFQLLLQRMPRAEIAEYFRHVVNLEPCNPIIDARFPYISLGSAGTHFLQHRNGSTLDRFAAFRTTNGVSHVPSDEEWFDVHDVERYLLNQGIEVGEFPSSTLMMSHPLSPKVGSSSLVASREAMPGGMMMIVDEYKLVNRLSQCPIALGCVAGFRRSDVERIVSDNVRGISVEFASLTW
ncbi:hypothetical protein N7475_009330 [Penicillium sp. IBT 31633x]|nr:hypothetical protein N7475_009330 [Penicillium sp. IBT 31633x]